MIIPQGTTRGISVVEVLVGTAIVSTLLFVVTSAFVGFARTAATTAEYTKATWWAYEAHELMRHLRDDDWTTIDALPIDTPRYLDDAGSSIAIATTPETEDGYTRTILVREVYRDGDDDIVASTTAGATRDDDARFIDVNVTWNDEVVRNRSLLTNIFNR